MRDIKHIVIHCSASPNGKATVNVGVIDAWHKERGWKSIGYHYVIETDGRLSIGRLEDEIGAHVVGSNASSIGVCMVGTDRFSFEQWRSLAQLVSGLQYRYPGAKVLGHRDFSPDKDGDGVIEEWEWMKKCPGFEVSAWLAAGMEPTWSKEHTHEPVPAS